MSEVKKEKKSRKVATSKTKEKVKETKTKAVKKTDTVIKTRAKANKEENAILNSKDQKTYTTLCKIAKVLTKIVRICLMIAVPFIFLLLLVIPIIFKKVEINSNIIRIGDASVILRSDSINFKYGDDIKTIYYDSDDLNSITNYIMNNSTGKIAFTLEMILLMAGVIVILDIYILSYIENLLSNFIKDKIPFTDENTALVLKTCKVLLAAKIVVLILTIIDLPCSKIASFSITEILIAFIIYYIFKYATNMQKIANTKMCD